MTLNQIVEELYRLPALNQFIGKLKPDDLQADLKQHCFCELYRIAEKYPGKIEALHERDQLFAWMVGAIKMQLFSSRSTFSRRFRRQFINLDSIRYDVALMPDVYVDFELRDEQSKEPGWKQQQRNEDARVAYIQIERPRITSTVSFMQVVMF